MAYVSLCEINSIRRKEGRHNFLPTPNKHAAYALMPSLPCLCLLTNKSGTWHFWHVLQAFCLSFSAGEHTHAFKLFTMQEGKGRKRTPSLTQVLPRLTSLACQGGCSVPRPPSLSLSLFTAMVFSCMCVCFSLCTLPLPACKKKKKERRKNPSGFHVTSEHTQNVKTCLHMPALHISHIYPMLFASMAEEEEKTGRKHAFFLLFWNSVDIIHSNMAHAIYLDSLERSWNLSEEEKKNRRRMTVVTWLLAWPGWGRAGLPATHCLLSPCLPYMPPASSLQV